MENHQDTVRTSLSIHTHPLTEAICNPLFPGTDKQVTGLKLRAARPAEMERDMMQSPHVFSRGPESMWLLGTSYNYLFWQCLPPLPLSDTPTGQIGSSQ